MRCGSTMPWRGAGRHSCLISPRLRSQASTCGRPPTTCAAIISRENLSSTRFPGLPGKEVGHAADIEALDVAQRRLWLTGSRGLTRRAHGTMRRDCVDPKIRKRLSRRPLGSVPLTKKAPLSAPANALPLGQGACAHDWEANPISRPSWICPVRRTGLTSTIFNCSHYRGPVHGGRSAAVFGRAALSCNRHG
jgi:hypothetical protein